MKDAAMEEKEKKDLLRDLTEEDALNSEMEIKLEEKLPKAQLIYCSICRDVFNLAISFSRLKMKMITCHTNQKSGYGHALLLQKSLKLII